jgi:dynein heavy chain
MSPQIVEAINAVGEMRVPTTWLVDPSGAEISWLAPNLGAWLKSMIDRHYQMWNWVQKERPPSFWLTGFFNPQGFLTAMKQEVTRKHKADKWALDDVVYHTEVTDYNGEHQVKSNPPNNEGIYIHGLYLDGGAWGKHEGHLIESTPKVLFVGLPVLLVTANARNLEEKEKKSYFGPQGPYECPCYKYSSRTDRYFIFFVNLKCTAEKYPNYWALRGVALLCNQ